MIPEECKLEKKEVKDDSSEEKLQVSVQCQLVIGFKVVVVHRTGCLHG